MAPVPCLLNVFFSDPWRMASDERIMQECAVLRGEAGSQAWGFGVLGGYGMNCRDEAPG